MYNRTTVQGATFIMHGQLYCGHANAMALFSSPVVSALDSESDDLGSSPDQGTVLCSWDVRGKKKQALLLGLAKSIYYGCLEIQNFPSYAEKDLTHREILYLPTSM